MINSRQRAYLRSLANNIPARYQIGKGEISENQIKMLQKHHVSKKQKGKTGFFEKKDRFLPKKKILGKS